MNALARGARARDHPCMSTVLDAVRTQVAEAVDEGASLEEVEEALLNPAPVSHDQRDALWLYAWSLQQRFQRPARAPRE